MTKLKEIYKCNVCGNIVEVLHTGVGELVCCGEAMELKKEKSEDEGQEKHVPLLEKSEKELKAIVGSTPHPMKEEHYIEWIEIVSDNGYCRKFLKPNDDPEAEFEMENENISVREYCNVHGLWENKDTE
ncbi:MAG: desulfoferrodoxin [Patescibacteria group bacterium]